MAPTYRTPKMLTAITAILMTWGRSLRQQPRCGKRFLLQCISSGY